jgi:hypothetical protein
MNIEDTIKRVEALINRKLEGVEYLIVAISHQEGILFGKEYKDKKE